MQLRIFATEMSATSSSPSPDTFLIEDERKLHPVDFDSLLCTFHSALITRAEKMNSSSAKAYIKIIDAKKRSGARKLAAASTKSTATTINFPQIPIFTAGGYRSLYVVGVGKLIDCENDCVLTELKISLSAEQERLLSTSGASVILDINSLHIASVPLALVNILSTVKNSDDDVVLNLFELIAPGLTFPAHKLRSGDVNIRIWLNVPDDVPMPQVSVSAELFLLRCDEEGGRAVNSSKTGEDYTNVPSVHINKFYEDVHICTDDELKRRDVTISHRASLPHYNSFIVLPSGTEIEKLYISFGEERALSCPAPFEKIIGRNGENIYKVDYTKTNEPCQKHGGELHTNLALSIGPVIPVNFQLKLKNAPASLKVKFFNVAGNILLSSDPSLYGLYLS